MRVSRYPCGAGKAGCTPTIRVAGSNGTAAIIWGAAYRKKMRGNEVILNVDHLPGHLTVPTFGSKMARIKCGSIGAPAVKMFVLSATGDPVAFVNLFSVDMMDSSVVLARLRRLQACRRPEQLQCFDF
jgi:hypothetical protein